MSFATTTFDALAAQLGGLVKFARGAQSVEVKGIFEVQQYRVRDSNGALVEFSSHDLLLRADQLILAGVRVQPQRGDTITRVVEDRRHVFEVQFPDQGQQPFRWSDPSGHVLRIHTGLISDDEVTA